MDADDVFFVFFSVLKLRNVYANRKQGQIFAK